MHTGTHGQTHTHMHTTPEHSEQQANTLSDVLDVRRLFLCLCWCYLQMNIVLCCSELAPVHSALRWQGRDYFSKRRDTLPILLHSYAFLSNSSWFIFSVFPPVPSSVRLWTLLCPLYLLLGQSNFLIPPLILFISLNTQAPSISFPPPMSKSHILSLTPLTTPPPSAPLSFPCRVKAVCCLGVPI